MIDELINRVKRKWARMRLQPIRVFCFHQVSEVFDASTMYQGDWMQIEQFKRNIVQLKKQYTFIPLKEAYDKLTHDLIRCKKYAVLTADDGWASLKNILPWLNEQQIPVTLFVNPAYLKREETRENGMNGLLIWDELKELLAQYPNITIASHGWSHKLACDMCEEEFEESVIRTHRFLEVCDKYISFYAYPCGRHTSMAENVLKRNRIVPVYMDGNRNYNYNDGIHRELLDGLSF